MVNALEGGGRSATYDDLDALYRPIVDAAIDADLTHRGWEREAEGQWRYAEFRVTLVGTIGKVEQTDEGFVVATGTLDDFDPFRVITPRAEDWKEYLLQIKHEVFDFWPAEIAGVFDPWTGIPEPSVLDDDVRAARRAADRIRVEPGSGTTGDGPSPGRTADIDLTTAVGNVKGGTRAMNGTSVGVFANYYAEPLGGVVAHQSLAVDALEIALRAEREVLARSRTDVLETAHKAVAAMRASGTLKVTTDELTVKLTVVACLGAVAATVVSGGAGVPAAVAFVLAASGAGAGATETILGATSAEEREAVELGADTPQGVVTEIRNALDRIGAAAGEQESALVMMLDHFHEESYRPLRSAGLEGSTGFLLARPGLIDTGSVDDVLREPGSAGDIDMTEEQLGYVVAGQRVITRQLAKAASFLDIGSGGFWRPSRVGLGTLGCHASFSALQDRVVELLTQTSVDLEEAVDVLQIAFKHLGVADDAANDELATYRQELAEVAAAERREQRRQDELEASRPRHVQPAGGMSLT